MAHEQILSSYIVTFRTFALLNGKHPNPFFTQVIESNRTFFVEKTPLEIMRDSCAYYRTNLEAIIESSKKDLKKRHKPPIMLTHSHNKPLLFFPLLSPSLHQNTWVAFHAFKDAHPHTVGVSLTLKNNTKLLLNTSMNTVYRQVTLSHVLSQRFDHRQEELSSSYSMVMEPKHSDSPTS